MTHRINDNEVNPKTECGLEIGEGITLATIHEAPTCKECEISVESEAYLNINRLHCHNSKEPCLRVTTIIDEVELNISECYRKDNESLPSQIREAMRWDADFGWLIKEGRT